VQVKPAAFIITIGITTCAPWSECRKAKSLSSTWACSKLALFEKKGFNTLIENADGEAFRASALARKYLFRFGLCCGRNIRKTHLLGCD
jgi:hypothetical protein